MESGGSQVKEQVDTLKFHTVISKSVSTQMQKQLIDQGKANLQMLQQ